MKIVELASELVLLILEQLDTSDLISVLHSCSFLRLVAQRSRRWMRKLTERIGPFNTSELGSSDVFDMYLAALWKVPDKKIFIKHKYFSKFFGADSRLSHQLAFPYSDR
jgi:hypothetical protein